MIRTVMNALNMILFFDQIRFQDNLIFFYFRNAKDDEFFGQFRIEKLQHFKRRFPIELFLWKRVDMGCDQVRCILVTESKTVKIRFLRTDIADLLVIVFKRSFLTALHGITVEDSGSAGTVFSFFDFFRHNKFASSVGQKNLYFRIEQFLAKDIFQEQDALIHGL